MSHDSWTVMESKSIFWTYEHNFQFYDSMVNFAEKRFQSAKSVEKINDALFKQHLSMTMY